MALVLKGGAVFLHVPKTGGTWVTSILEQCGLVEGTVGHKHADVDRLLAPEEGGPASRLVSSARRRVKSVARRLRGKPPEVKLPAASPPFMFCFVRHPLRWYESWYRYMSQPHMDWKDWGREGEPGRWHPNRPLNGLGDEDFNGFMENVVEARPGYVTEMFSWYTRPEVAFVGRQENLREDLIRVLDRLELPFDEELIRNAPRKHVSRPRDEVEVRWDPELKEEVRRLEYAGIRRYGYE